MVCTLHVELAQFVNYRMSTINFKIKTTLLNPHTTFCGKIFSKMYRIFSFFSIQNNARAYKMYLSENYVWSILCVCECRAGESIWYTARESQCNEIIYSVGGCTTAHVTLYPFILSMFSSIYIYPLVPFEMH